MFEINPNVKKYVEAKDVEGVRLTLTGMAYIGDKDSFSEFKESSKYALENMDGLFELDDGEDLSVTNSLVGYKKIAKLMMNNFSQKKYEAVIAIGLEVFENNQGIPQRKENSKEGESSFPSALTYPIIIGIVLIVIIAFVMMLAK